MTRIKEIAFGCSALVIAGALHAISMSAASASQRGFANEPAVALIPAASTEKSHALEGLNVLPLLNDYEAFVVRLLLTKGHLRAGFDAYEAGNVSYALAHFGQPVEVLHRDLDRWLHPPGAKPLETPLDPLVAAVRANMPVEDVYRELESSLHELDRAIEKIDKDIRESPPFIMLVAISVLRAAVDEYELAVSDGQIVDEIEYQDARAFTHEVQAFTQGASTILTARNAGARGILVAEIAAFEMALRPATKFQRPMTTIDELRRAVVRIGLLYDSFK